MSEPTKAEDEERMRQWLDDPANWATQEECDALNEAMGHGDVIFVPWRVPDERSDP